MSKAKFRAELKEIRKNIQNKGIKNTKIAENFFSIINDYNTVLLYLSFNDEVDTYKIAEILMQNKIEVYAPKTYGNYMEFYQIESLNDLEEGKFGIKEPKITKKYTHHEKAICIVPGLGFDLNHNRIGYGRGYYDKFLQKNNVISLALCYNEQILPFIPTDEHDQKIDIIITDTQIRRK